MKTCSVSVLVLIIVLFSYISRQPTIEGESANALIRKALFRDSVVVLLTNGNSNNELEFEDYFGGKLTLQKGVNRLILPIIIKDIDWRHQTTFVFDEKMDSIVFYRDNEGFFYIKTANDKLDKELNFDVYYRKNISPILSHEWGRSKFIKELYVHDVNARQNDINTYFDSKSYYLNSYRDKYDLSDRFLEKWRNVIHYEKIASALFVGSKYELWPRGYLLELDKAISEFNHDEFLYLPKYREGCIESLYLRAFLMLGKSVMLSQYYELAEKNFTKKTKDYLLLSLLLQSQDKYGAVKTTKVEYAQLLDKFLNSCQTKEFADYISKRKLPDNMKGGQNKLLNTDRQQVSFVNVSHQSTLNYIDFWASWCVPCRAEMPDSKKLSEKYRSKGVNFIYISIDENPAAWERAMNQLGLPRKNSYLLPYFKKSSIYKEYKIAIIPRYLLIDKRGNVLSADAPRPSDPMIGEMFDKLLK